MPSAKSRAAPRPAGRVGNPAQRCGSPHAPHPSRVFLQVVREAAVPASCVLLLPDGRENIVAGGRGWLPLPAASPGSESIRTLHPSGTVQPQNSASLDTVVSANSHSFENRESIVLLGAPNAACE